jgi:hypothetical protein
MSSALLYVAIVVIWACVLIPRWLRRGSSAANPTEETPLYSERSAPSLPLSAPVSIADADQDELSAEDYADELEAEPAGDEVAVGEVAPARPGPLSREESRRRMLAARRRLLMILLALEAAACALTVLGLAALWVLIPPTVMLAGYMLLLREASKADREAARRADEEAETRARTAASQAARRAAEGAARAAAGPVRRRLATEEIVETRATAPAEPSPEDYEDLGTGRDFAPGLPDVDEREYRRAVGD